VGWGIRTWRVRHLNREGAIKDRRPEIPISEENLGVRIEDDYCVVPDGKPAAAAPAPAPAIMVLWQLW